VCVAKSLERDLAPDLPVSWKLLADGSSKRPIRQVWIHKQIWVIEKIEELKPHFEIHPLRYAGVLVSGEIRFGETRLPELLWLLVAIRA
jgi:hypothetical protein